MNQENHNNEPAMVIPEVGSHQISEQIPAMSAHEAASAQAVEQAHSAPSAAPPLPFAQDPPQQASSAVPTVSGVPHVADDVDLIEKEWVEKAKEIVARTKLDPYAQSAEVSRMKADYIKKRYNKDIKVADK